jgi:eukaryotic translation initiation factor 2C
MVVQQCCRSEKNTDGGDATKRSRISPRGRDYKVKLEYVATVKMGAIMDMLRGQRNDRAQDAVRVLDIVLRQHSASK